METLKQLKEIYDNAEKLDSATGFIQVKNSVYYTKIVNGVLFEYLESHSSWVRCLDFDDVDSIRSLSDIKQIIELMECQPLKYEVIGLNSKADVIGDIDWSDDL